MYALRCILVLSVLAFTVSAGTGCLDPGATITFENATSRTVVVYADGRPLVHGNADIPPGESVAVADGESSWQEHLSALDENKQLVWEADITWGQLKQMGFLVVIEPETSYPNATTLNPVDISLTVPRNTLAPPRRPGAASTPSDAPAPGTAPAPAASLLHGPSRRSGILTGRPACPAGWRCYNSLHLRRHEEPQVHACIEMHPCSIGAGVHRLGGNRLLRSRRRGHFQECDKPTSCGIRRWPCRN